MAMKQTGQTIYKPAHALSSMLFPFYPHYIHYVPIFYFRALRTLVMACLMIVPAFSVSFFVKPEVTQTLRAG